MAYSNKPIVNNLAKIDERLNKLEPILRARFGYAYKADRTTTPQAHLMIVCKDYREVLGVDRDNIQLRCRLTTAIKLNTIDDQEQVTLSVPMDYVAIKGLRGNNPEYYKWKFTDILIADDGNRLWFMNSQMLVDLLDQLQANPQKVTIQEKSYRFDHPVIRNFPFLVYAKIVEGLLLESIEINWDTEFFSSSLVKNKKGGNSFKFLPKQYLKYEKFKLLQGGWCECKQVTAAKLIFSSNAKSHLEYVNASSLHGLASQVPISLSTLKKIVSGRQDYSTDKDGNLWIAVYGNEKTINEYCTSLMKPEKNTRFRDACISRLDIIEQVSSSQSIAS